MGSKEKAYIRIRDNFLRGRIRLLTDEMNKAMIRELNEFNWGNGKAISKKKWTRWLRFWNWRLRLKGEVNVF